MLIIFSYATLFGHGVCGENFVCGALIVATCCPKSVSPILHPGLNREETHVTKLNGPEYRPGQKHIPMWQAA